MSAVLPTRRNRKEEREYDRCLCKLRHLAENAFLVFKRWREIATRYAKYTLSIAAAIQIRCIAIWAKVFCITYYRRYPEKSTSCFCEHIARRRA